MVNIHKWFGKVYALRGVDFKVYPAEVVGLVGDNGAGKSTLIKILSGVYPPDRGEILFEGKSAGIYSPKVAMRLGIETMHQDQTLIPSLTIARNMFLGRELGGRLLDMKKMNSDSLKAMRELGLIIADPEVAVEALSGGERQGVALSRALYFKTKLIILDEPTNNLSVKETAKVLDIIRNLRETGVTSIFITHNIHHVYPISDRIVILSHGRKICEFKKEKTSIEEITECIISDRSMYRE